MHLRLVQLFSVMQFPDISELAERCLIQISRLPDPGMRQLSLIPPFLPYLMCPRVCVCTGPPDARVLVQGGLQPLLHLLQCGHSGLQRYGLQCVAELSRFQLLQVVRLPAIAADAVVCCCLLLESAVLYNRRLVVVAGELPDVPCCGVVVVDVSEVRS